MSPLCIYRAQWRALQSIKDGHHRSIIGFIVIYMFPILAGVAILVLKVNFSFAETLLAVLGILAGALITAFSQISNWRQLVGEDKGYADNPERWLLDVSVAHILAGAYSAVLASVLVLLMQIIQIPVSKIIPTWVHHIGFAIVAAITMHVIMSIILAIPNLYCAYVQINNVPDILNGEVDKVPRKYR